jgi:hypothetical protein
LPEIASKHEPGPHSGGECYAYESSGALFAASDTSAARHWLRSKAGAASGNVRWVVPNEQAQIATDYGGVIRQSGIAYDQNGNAKGQMGGPRIRGRERIRAVQCSRSFLIGGASQLRVSGGPVRKPYWQWRGSTSSSICTELVREQLLSVCLHTTVRRRQRNGLKCRLLLSDGAARAPCNSHHRLEFGTPVT